MFTVSELAGEARSLHSVFSVWKEKQFSATPMARLGALKHSVRWTREGQGELKCRPLRNLSSTSFFLFLLLLYTFLKCCFNWHKEKKASFVGPAPLSCQLSKCFSLLFLVHHSSSAFDSWALPSFLCFSQPFSVSSSSRSLPLLQLNTSLFPTDCLCCFSLPLSSLSTYLHLPVVSPHSWLVSTAPLSPRLWLQTVYTFVS